MKKILTVLIIFMSSSAFAQNQFHTDIRASQSLSLPGQYFAIFNHNSEWWDREKSSQSGTLALLKKIEELDYGFVTIGAFDSDVLFSEKMRERYYLDSANVDYSLISNGGEHNISFPNSKVIVFSGGKLSECLCESIRDTIGNSSKNKKELNIILIADAIYDSTFFVNNYLENRNQSPLGVFPVTLTNILEVLKKEEIKDYFAKSLIGENHFCPYAYKSSEHSLDPRDFRFIFKIGNEEIGLLGVGEILVNIQLSSIDNMAADVETAKH